LTFLTGQHHRKALGPFATGKLPDRAEWFPNDLLIQEHQGIQGLVLGTGRDFPLHGEIFEVLLDRLRPQLPRRFQLVKGHKAPHPVLIGLFRTEGIVPRTDLPPQLPQYLLVFRIDLA
jgi:hypothetical protein